MNSGDLVHGKVTLVNSTVCVCVYIYIFTVLYISKSLREQVVNFFLPQKKNYNYVMGKRKVLCCDGKHIAIHEYIKSTCTP